MVGCVVLVGSLLAGARNVPVGWYPTRPGDEGGYIWSCGHGRLRPCGAGERQGDGLIPAVPGSRPHYKRRLDGNESYYGSTGESLKRAVSIMLIKSTARLSSFWASLDNESVPARCRKLTCADSTWPTAGGLQKRARVSGRQGGVRRKFSPAPHLGSSHSG